MTRTVTAILILLYFSFSTGLAVNIHYCMNSSTVQIEKSNTGCDACGKKAGDCCKNELYIFKVSDAHQPAFVNAEIHSPEILLHVLNIFHTALHQQTAPESEALANPPPLLSPPKFFIQNCVFRI